VVVSRRRWVRVAGSVAVALVLASLASCGASSASTASSASSTHATVASTAKPAAAVAKTTTTVRPVATTTTTTIPPGPQNITLAFAGDLLPHGPINSRAAQYGRATGKPYDYAPMLAPMAPIISKADVAICHMEVPVAPPGQPITTYPSFGSPPQLVEGAKSAGYDGCSNASNHSLDRGRAGIQATLDRFDQDGMHHAGTARTALEAITITKYQVKGVTVAHLSYAYDFNGYHLPADAPWAANKIDPKRIRADAARARREGADLVVVSLHWGTEYDSNPNQFQRDVASQILTSKDISLVIGCHAHVVQPIGKVNGTYVVWGMGNQLANQRQVPKSDGITVIATAHRAKSGKWGIAGIEAVPTWIEGGSFRVLPVVATLKNPATPAGLRAELNASYDRTLNVLRRQRTNGVTVAAKP